MWSWNGVMGSMLRMFRVLDVGRFRRVQGDGLKEINLVVCEKDLDEVYLMIKNP